MKRYELYASSSDGDTWLRRREYINGPWVRYEDAQAEVYRLTAENERLRVALIRCHATFAGYVAVHKSKGTAEGERKAAANQEMVDFIATALAASGEEGE